jgi:hypothetical protein
VDTSGNGISISHVVDDEGSVQGNLASGSHTDDATPGCGPRDAGSIVKVYVDGKLVDSVIADRDRAMAVHLNPALSADGVSDHRDRKYRYGDSANAPFELTLDTRVPTGSLDGVTDDVGLVQGDWRTRMSRTIPPRPCAVPVWRVMSCLFTTARP